MSEYLFILCIQNLTEAIHAPTRFVKTLHGQVVQWVNWTKWVTSGPTGIKGQARLKGDYLLDTLVLGSVQ